MELENELKQHVDGEIRFDEISCHVYSVDASIYEIKPIGIVLPRTKEALITAVTIANRHRIPVIARGAATGITGGCLGHGLIIDTSKYLNRILEINIEKGYAICEPGVVQDDLNAAVAAYGLRLGPDTSTGNRATLGGMLANNAAGAHSLLFGQMADHVEEIELILAGGDVLHLSSIAPNSGSLFSGLNKLKERYQDVIAEQMPVLPRRVSGYNLDALLENPINPCRLICGSEGTLGIVSKMRVKLSRIPHIAGLCLLFGDDPIKMMQSVPEMLSYHPISIEMIDRTILDQARNSPLYSQKLSWLPEISQAVFSVEFTDSIKMQEFQQHFQNYHPTILSDPTEIKDFWEIRKAGLGLLLSRRSYTRAIAFLEDVSVPPAHLASFMQKFQTYFKEAGVYGHVGSGCMHVRPFINIQSNEEMKTAENMMVKLTELLREYGGVLSGEHGDGLVRSWLNRKLYGETLYQAFIDLKNLFDPDHLMNPGKIVEGTPFAQDLRTGPNTAIHEIPTFLDFSREGGLALAADLCNGNGACRKKEGIMCPSFQATDDEYDSTRARAQLLRDIIHGELPPASLAQKGLIDVLDLCLECKGCKKECPSQVDMAKMKAEVLFQYQEKNGASIRSHLFASMDNLLHYASLFPWIYRAVQKLGINSWFGIAKQRSLPSLSNNRFSKIEIQQPTLEKSVVLFNDTYCEFHTPNIGLSAVQVLNALGYHVIIPPYLCCGRPAFSKGFLKHARHKAEALIKVLLPYAEAKIPIIGLEPSCLFMIKDDYQSLVTTQASIEIVAKSCITFDAFVARHEFSDFKPSKDTLLVHTHCHQKALEGTTATLEALQKIPGSVVHKIEAGCCGMAGSFGYEREHVDISMKIGNLHLFPTIRNSEEKTLICANGFSCRTQVMDGTSRQSLHLAEILARYL